MSIGASLTGPLIGEFAPQSAHLVFANYLETASWTIEPPTDSSSETSDFGLLEATWSHNTFNGPLDTVIGTMSARLFSVDVVVVSVPESSSFALLATMFLCSTRRRILKSHQ